MHTVTRKLTFCAGHRVYGHENKCAFLHGHNYVAEVMARPNNGLDSIGRVVDFGVLKLVVGNWIDTHWDHKLILWDADPLCESLTEVDAKVVRLPSNPTAENLAAMLLSVSNQLLTAEPIVVCRVRLWETSNCYADATA